MQGWPSLLRRLSRWLLSGLLLCVIAIGVSVMCARWYLANKLKQDDFSYLATHVVHAPVSVGHLSIQWYGFEPRINLKQVTVLNPTTRLPVLTIQYLVVQINLISSLLHRELIPSQFIGRGVHVHLSRNLHRELVLSAHAQQHQQRSILLKRVVHWLLIQPRVFIDQVTITGMPGLALHQLSLMLVNRSDQHQVWMTAEIGKQALTHFVWRSNFTAHRTDLGDLKGRAYLSVTPMTDALYQTVRTTLPSRMTRSIAHLSGSASAWFSFNASAIQSATVRYAVKQMRFKAGQLTDLQGLVTVRRQKHGFAMQAQVDQGQLILPSWFHHPLHLGQLYLQGNQRVQAGRQHIHIDQLAWLQPDVQLRLSGSFQQTRAAPILRVLGRIQVPQLSKLHSYMPLTALPPQLASWLNQVFQSGTLSQGRFLLMGPLSSGFLKQTNSRLQFDADVHSSTLQFAPGWPPLFAPYLHVAVRQASLDVLAPHAYLFGNPISQVAVSVKNLMRPRLDVRLQSETNAACLVELLEASPLLLSRQFDSMQLFGGMGLQLHLDIPLYHPMVLRSRVMGKVQFHNAHVQLPRWHLRLDQLMGRLSFHDGQLMTSDLTAALWGRPISIALQSIQQGLDALTRVHVNGVVDIARLSQHLGWSWMASHYTGRTAFGMRLDLHGNQSDKSNDLYLSSTLQGLVSHQLPAPFARQSHDRTPLRLVMSIHPDYSIFLRGQYGNTLRAALIYHEKQNGFGLYAGRLRLNGSPPAFPTTPGLTLQGHVTSVDATQWMAFLRTYSTPRVPSHSLDTLAKHVALTIDRLSWNTLHWRHVVIQALSRGRDWTVQAKSEKNKGRLVVPADPHRAWSAHFSMLTVPVMSSQSTPLPWSRWYAMPPVTISIDQLWLHHRNSGQWYMTSEPTANGVWIKTLTWHTPTHALQLSGHVTGLSPRQHTQLTGVLRSKDWGQLQRQWHITPLIRDGQGQMDFALAWQGAPTQIDWASLKGQLNYQLASGSLVSLSANTQKAIGLGRLLNLMSLSALFQHVKSSFKDMPAHGLWFKTLDGQWKIERGVAKTTHLLLKGSVANIEGRGALDLVHHRSDLWLAVTPQLTGSLPVVAGLLGGPVVGVAAWLVNKVVGEEVDHRSDSMLHITGSWSHAHVQKLHRVGNHWV